MRRQFPTRAIWGFLRILTIGLVPLLVACGGGEKEKYAERSVDELYNEGVDALKVGQYQVAAVRFDEVERQHPYSIWATKAQLMAGYAYYENNNYDEAVLALERFIQLHPGNRDTAYVYYLKALCYYERISDVKRDQKMTTQALISLNEIVRRFPSSTYARDARLKIDLTTDHLAGKEMDIGRFYLRQEHYLAAINRFRQVVDRFQTTSHVAEALHRLTEAYLALGVIEEARKAAAVLGHNYPGSEWYIDSYALLTGVDVRSPDETENRSWLGRTWNWMF